MLLTETAREKTLFASWIVLNSALICFLLFACMPQLTDFLYGKKDGWIGDLVQYLYPRFGVERHRFDPAFFIAKAYQFVWRYILFLFIPVTCIGFYKPFRNRFFAFFKPQETAALQPYLPFLVTVLFLFLYDSLSTANSAPNAFSLTNDLRIRIPLNASWTNVLSLLCCT